MSARKGFFVPLEELIDELEESREHLLSFVESRTGFGDDAAILIEMADDISDRLCDLNDCIIKYNDLAREFRNRVKRDLGNPYDQPE